MRKLTVLAVLIFAIACRTASIVDIGVPTSFAEIPSAAAAPDADHAEVALYIGARFVEATVIAINELHARGVITDARYEALVRAPDSVARKIQRDGLLLTGAIDMWRATGKRPPTFGAPAAELQTLIAQIAEGVK